MALAHGMPLHVANVLFALWSMESGRLHLPAAAARGGRSGVVRRVRHCIKENQPVPRCDLARRDPRPTPRPPTSLRATRTNAEQKYIVVKIFSLKSATFLFAPLGQARKARGYGRLRHSGTSRL